VTLDACRRLHGRRSGLDSLVFVSLAFVSTIPLPALGPAIVTQWILKVLYEVAATPLTYRVINFLKRRERVGVVGLLGRG
jgi:uncharacterized PurR-regulated membrane protein YhhQ (DUF165 family)